MTTLHLNSSAANGRADKVELDPVLSVRVPLVWDDIQSHIAEIVALNLGRLSAEDLFIELIARRMQLWLVRRGRKILMAGITTIRVYPDCKTANVIGISGTDIDSWLRFEADIRTWAKGEGCVAIDVVSRRGWARKLQGWKEVGVVLTTSLGD